MRPQVRPPSMWTVPSSGRTGTSTRSCNTCNWRPYGWRPLGGSGSAFRRSIRSLACEAPTAEPHGGRWGRRSLGDRFWPRAGGNASVRGVMGPGGCDDGACDVTPECIVGGDERQLDCDTLVHGGVGKALGAPVAVGLVGELVADGGQVI